ncbi:hypothetical protein BVX97_03995 [bacterium E08(2017)]|nr:hypothetical protein BVX97_03995 [bacterium E08(2017)]
MHAGVRIRNFTIAMIGVAASIYFAFVLGPRDTVDSDFIYTMQDIHEEHMDKGDDLIEIIGYAQEPLKRLMPITIAGVEGGKGSVLVYDQPNAREKLFEAIDGYETRLTPYIGKDKRVVYAVWKKKF